MNKGLRKVLLVTLACATMTGLVGGGTAMAAGYTLSSEVKTATPALKKAAEIGVRTNKNPALAHLADKDALIVMSFGTTFKATRAKTIDATVDAIKKAHPNLKVVTAFTSHIIIDRIKAKEGITYPTPEEACDQLTKEGYTNVAMTNLNIIPGMEYNYNVAVYDIYKNNFKNTSLGVPLMYWMGQEDQRDDIADTMKAFSTQFPKLGQHDAVLIMTHGTPDPANAYYSVMQDRLNALGYKGKAFIYSVEGWPHLDTVMPMLKAEGIKNVTLMPLMMVAGDHANNDMAGSEPDSHKSILEKAGYKVSTYLHGAGENTAIRNLFVARADEAVNALHDVKK